MTNSDFELYQVKKAKIKVNVAKDWRCHPEPGKVTCKLVTESLFSTLFISTYIKNAQKLDGIAANMILSMICSAKFHAETVSNG